jgi:hypothetical protein
MKTGKDVVRKGLYHSECCLLERELQKAQSFPRCPKCLNLTIWSPVSFSAKVPKTKAA